MNIPQVNVEELTIKQRLERLGFQVIRNEAPDGRFLGMSVLKDGKPIHDSPRFHVDSAEELCISLGG